MPVFVLILLCLFLFARMSATRQADGPQSSTRTPWAQCDDCLKWRRMPWHTDPAQLGEKWFCNQNTWDLERASCDVSPCFVRYCVHARCCRLRYYGIGINMRVAGLLFLRSCFSRFCKLRYASFQYSSVHFARMRFAVCSVQVAAVCVLRFCGIHVAYQICTSCMCFACILFFFFFLCCAVVFFFLQVLHVHPAFCSLQLALFLYYLFFKR